MEPFLKQVAKDVYEKYGNHLADVAVVFPNKRAGLFFNEYLKEMSNVPLWSPAYMTINELFQENSPNIEGDPILLISKLHKEYCLQTRSDEPLDKFYYWGEMLLKDFDEIDKNLVDAQKLFANLKELRAIGNTSDSLDEEQKEAIKQFFTNFKLEEESEIKRRFLAIWEVLLPIYTNFRNTLRNDGIVYSGLMHRDIIENMESITLPYEKYIFIGFNALNKVEDAMFNEIKKRGKAHFYWDYDTAYTENKHHEAGRFIRQSLQRYPNALQDGNYSNLNKDKKITFVSTSTDNIQTRYLAEWLGKNVDKNEIETAVVLCNEELLEEVLHTIPPSIENINVTMGYPVSRTPIYSFMRRLIDLQIKNYDTTHNTFRYEAVHAILKHPYTLQCSGEAARLDKEITDKHHLLPTTTLLHADEFLSKIFSHHTNNISLINNIRDIIYTITNAIDPQNGEKDVYQELFQESLFCVYTQAQRLASLLENNELPMQSHTLASLFMRIIAGSSLPFHGEPVVGLQIMGVLETRNLDFKNLILLSANEGNLPRNSSDNSFIPYNLRRAFGLMLTEHRNSIYAYNFYRLIQRAENITMLFNNSADGAGQGERSRYMLQMLAERNNHIKEIHLKARQQTTTYTSVEVRKSNEIIEKLRQLFDTNINNKAVILSPSGINRYLDCPMKFFYYYVANLKPQLEVESTIKAVDFGNIFHKAAELFYEHIVRDGTANIVRSQLEPYAKNSALLYTFVDRAFKECFFTNATDEKPEYDGLQYINREVLHRFLVRLVKMDMEHTPFTYLGSEQATSFTMTATTAKGEKVALRIGGRVDRMEQKGDTLEIIDYKTGGEPSSPESINSLFAKKGKRSGYIFQAMLYSASMIASGKATRISPSLLYIHKQSEGKRENFVVKINKQPVVDVNEYYDSFIASLQETLDEIFNINIPFSRTEEKSRCAYCDYKSLCGED